MVYSLSRETHVSELTAVQTTRFDHLFIYSDGLGREAQRKAQGEPGPVPGVGPSVSPRWVGSGWTIYNNKGKPVRKYEPFFSQSHAFEFNRQAGVSFVVFYDPAERVVATLHPDNTFEKTIFDAWRQETWDANDTVLISDPRTDADAGDFFRRLIGNAPGAFTSWHDRRIGGAFGATPAERAANQDAAQKTAAHAETPGVIHFDAMGRTCLSVEDNGVASGLPQRFATRTALDTESKPLSIFDATGRRVIESCLREPLAGGGFRYVAGFDVAGNPLYRNGADDGERRTLTNIFASPFRTWDARGFVFRIRYDALCRPTHRFVGRAGFGETLIERFIYGEKHPDASRNLKGRVFHHYDGAGVAVNERYDFKGNLLESVRQFARHQPATQTSSFYNTTPDWSVITTVADAPTLNIAALEAASAPLLITADRFSTSVRFDASNRVTQTITPHRADGLPSVVQPTYNEANLLESVNVWIRQPISPTALIDPAATVPDVPAVANINYNARGQRELIALGNGVVTTFDHDAETFRLTTLTTTRPPSFPVDERTVQALFYQYDPIGNITRLRDEADIQNVVFFRNQRVEPSADYTYDALYRLKAATGREHLGQAGNALNPAQQVTNDDSFRVALLAPGDGNAMGNYTERYEYDSVGNLTQMVHEVASGGWTRRYAHAESSRISAAEAGNRLSASSLPGDSALGPFSARYAYDEHGNTTRMPHLPLLTWDELNRLQSTTRQSADAVMPETTYYCYDAGGERLRKITYASSAIGNTPRIRSERLYLGVFEIYREYDGAGNITKERETLHVTDDKKRIAIIETRTIGQDPAPPRLIRYQFGNHLGSASLELDHAAAVVSYEEYFPYGSTSYQGVRNQTETPKRYRYTGKERDEENDLYYHSARYYCPWLARWTSCDPAGTVDGPSLYAYVRANPIGKCDPSGTEGVYDEEAMVCRQESPTCSSGNPAGATSVPEANSIRVAPARSATPVRRSQPRPASTSALPPVSGPDNTLYVPQGAIYTQYQAALREVDNSDNPTWARITLGVLATAASPLALAEEYLARPLANVPYTVHNAGIGIGEHAARATLLAERGETGEAVVEGLQSVTSFSQGFVAAGSVAVPVAGALESRAAQATSRVNNFANDPYLVRGQQTRPATTPEIARYNAGTNAGGVEVGMATYTNRAPTLRLGNQTSVSMPSGPNVLSTSHTHPANSPAIFSGGDIRFYMTNNFARGATHSVTGPRWPTTNAVLQDLGQPVTSDLVTTVATQQQITTTGAVSQHPFWNWILSGSP